MFSTFFFPSSSASLFPILLVRVYKKVQTSISCLFVQPQSFSLNIVVEFMLCNRSIYPFVLCFLHPQGSNQKSNLVHISYLSVMKSKSKSYKIFISSEVDSTIPQIVTCLYLNNQNTL